MIADEPPANVSVGCGGCGSSNLYMETCATQGGPAGHHWVVGSECKNCGLRNDSPGLICHDCHPPARPSSEKT